MLMKVEQLLRKKGTRIISVRMDESVETAARMLRHENVGAVVVKDVCGTEGDVVVGMFSERDFLRAMVDRGPSVLKLPVSALMSREVVSCSPRDDLGRVNELLNRNQIRHLPVIDDHTLIGLISMRDIIAVAEEQGTPVEVSRSESRPVAA
jgi:CBS domain-containing protein